jgi:hypothetical protein
MNLKDAADFSSTFLLSFSLGLYVLYLKWKSHADR